jgi:exonuclease III
LCLTEHYLEDLQLEEIHIENYKLGVKYCRQTHEKGGLAIFVHNNLEFTNIDISQHGKEQDIEMCPKTCIWYNGYMCINNLQTPSGNFGSLLLKLDTILQPLYTPMLYFILCGDINININMKNQLDNLLLSYNLTSVIDFLTKVQNTYATAIDNFFIDISLYQSQS